MYNTLNKRTLKQRSSKTSLKKDLCPTWERGIAWDLKEMGSAWGRGVREGPAPQKAGKISSQSSARKEVTWRRKKKEGQVGRDEEGPVRTE
jgi:hypothetical protein